MVGSYHVTINPFIFFWDVQKLQKNSHIPHCKYSFVTVVLIRPRRSKNLRLDLFINKVCWKWILHQLWYIKVFDLKSSFVCLFNCIDSLIVLAFECCKQALRVMFKCRHCERSLTKFGQRTRSNMETFGKSFGNSKWFPISARTIDYNKLLWIRVVSFLSKIQYYTIDYHGHD